jgi:hypothetical protein
MKIAVRISKTALRGITIAFPKIVKYLFSNDFAFAFFTNI